MLPGLVLWTVVELGNMLKEAEEILSRSRSKEALDTGNPGR